MTIINAKIANEITKKHIDNPAPYEEYKSSRLHPLTPDYLFICIEDFAKNGKFTLPIRIPKETITSGFESGIRAWSCYLNKLGFIIHREETEDDIALTIDWSNV